MLIFSPFPGSFLTPDWVNLHKYIHRPELFLLYRINGNDPLNSPARPENMGNITTFVLLLLLNPRRSFWDLIKQNWIHHRRKPTSSSFSLLSKGEYKTQYLINSVPAFCTTWKKIDMLLHSPSFCAQISTNRDLCSYYWPPSSPDLRRQVALVLGHLARAQPLLTSPAVVTSPLPPAPSLLDTLALDTATCGDPGTWLRDTLQIRWG